MCNNYPTIQHYVTKEFNTIVQSGNTISISKGGHYDVTVDLTQRFMSFKQLFGVTRDTQH